MTLPKRYEAIRQRCEAAQVEWRGCRWNHATGTLLDEDIPTLLADIKQYETDKAKLIRALEPFAAIPFSSVEGMGYADSNHIERARAVLQEMRVTEAQAWRKIARAFEQYWRTGNRRGASLFGLCHAIDHVDWGKREIMRTRLRVASPQGDNVLDNLFWSCTRGNAQHRATLAGLLAAQADE